MCPVLDNSLSCILVQASSFYVMNYHNRLNYSHPLPTFTPFLYNPFPTKDLELSLCCINQCIIPLLATYQRLLSIPLALAYESQHGRLLSFSSSTSHTMFHLSPCEILHWPSVNPRTYWTLFHFGNFGHW